MHSLHLTISPYFPHALTPPNNFPHALHLTISPYFPQMKHQDSFGATANRIRQTLYTSHAPSDGKHRRNPHVLEEYITNPKWEGFLTLI